MSEANFNAGCCRKAALDSWHSAGRALRGRFGLEGQIEQRVREAFLKAIVGAYWANVFDFVTKEMGVSVSEFAREIGVHRGTPYRWLIRDEDPVDAEGYGSAKGSHEPTLRSFLLTLTAFDIDPSEDGVLPRGSSVALRAYCQAFDHLERVELGNASAAGIQPEEVLCLHFAVRNLQWRGAIDSFDRDELRGAAGNIFEHMRCYIEAPAIDSVEALAAVLKQRLRTWIILETILTYDWF